MKIGNSVGIIFNKNEQEIYNIKEGSIIDLSDITITKSLPRGNKNASKELGKSRSNKVKKKKGNQ